MFLEVENLSLIIEGNTILKGINFSLDRGSTLFIAGENGSGKTMLLKTLKGLINMSEGSVKLYGEVLSKSKRLRAFSLVFQEAALQIVGHTVKKDIAFGLENLGYKREDIEEKVSSFLSLFSAEELKDRRPLTLSGGEIKKIAIISSLVMGSEVLLLDEPFSGLDYPSVITLLKTIKLLKEKGITIIIVSHEAEKFLSLTDKTIILKKGKMVYCDESEKALPFLKENNIYIPKGRKFEDLTWL